MPKIATYEPNQVSTPVAQESTIAPVTVNYDTLIRGASQLGSAFTNMQKRIDTTSAEEALLAFEKAKNDLLFNPDTGYYNSQGRDAYDKSKETMTSLGKLKEEYGSKLSGGAKAMFGRAADNHIIKTGASVQQHASKGLKAWEISTIEAQVENSIENASLYWNNPDDLRVQQNIGEQAIIESGKMTGISDDAINEKLQTYRSSFYKGAINAALVKSADDAQGLYDKYESMIEGPDRLKVQEVIKTKGDAVKAIEMATALVAGSHSRIDIQNEINKIEDPELRKKTMSEAMSQFSQRKQAESEERMEIYENAEDYVLSGGSAERFKRDNPEEWNKLTARQKKSLRGGSGTGMGQTDWTLYSHLTLLPKKELAKIDPSDYFGALGKAERKALISAVKSARGEGSKSEKIESQVGRSRTTQTNDAVTQIFGAKKDRDPEKVNDFYSLLDSEVNYAEDLKGSKLTSAEYTEILSGLTSKTVIEKRFRPDPEKDIEDVFKEIPGNERESLINQLRKMGLPTTPKNIYELQKQATSKIKRKITDEDGNKLFPIPER